MKKTFAVLSFLIALSGYFADNTRYAKIFCIQEESLGEFVQGVAKLLKTEELLKVTIIQSDCKPTVGNTL